MSIVEEIKKALRGLNNEELQQVERELISLYRQRNAGMMFDDAYGVLTEEQWMASVGETWVMLDKAEEGYESGEN